MSSIAAMQANKKGSQLLPNNVLAWELWFILAHMPARGEPAQAGSEPGDGLRNGTGEAEVRERVGHGTCGPETYTLPGCPGC